MSYKRRTLSPDSPFAVVSALMMFMSAALLTVFYAWYSFVPQLIAGKAWLEMSLLYALPVTGCIVMAMMLISRKTNLMPTIIPVLMGTVYFAFRAVFTMTTGQCIFCCVVYAAFASTYILTVSGIINTRMIMLGLSGAIFIYHVFIKTKFFTAVSGSADILPEISMILILMSLITETWGMRRGRLYR